MEKQFVCRRHAAGRSAAVGQLNRIDFNEKWEELHRESMFRELQNRIRDVRQGPDGLLYVLTEENDGALLKMEPWAAPAPGR